MQKFRIYSSAIFLASILLSAVSSVRAQSDSSRIKFITSGALSSNLSLKDSCWWTNKVDTIQTDFVITVDENNFVKKQRTDFIVHIYEIKDCQYSAMRLWPGNTRNDIYLLNGKSVEVLLYRPKNQYGVLVGNSR